jgi:GT2 family glycosyltransferase
MDALTATAAATDVPTWVGLLDLDCAGPVTGVSGVLRDDHLLARILVRIHGAPLGFISVAPAPAQTLADRARATATATLAEGLLAHSGCQPRQADGLVDWTGQARCPLGFPATSGLGVTIAIPTRDRAGLLRDCLHAVCQSSHQPLQILVVDNAPRTSETRDLVAKLAIDDPRITYTCEPRAGISAARNHALVRARFDIVAFTDDDVLVDPGWVTAIAAGFRTDPDVACVTGFVAPSALDNPFQRYFEDRYPNQGAYAPSRYDLAEHRDPAPLYPLTAGLFGRGANMAVRRDYAREIGGFDPLLGVGAPCRGGEDLDFFVRVLRGGQRICYMPSALIWHRHRNSADALKRAVYLYGFGLGAYLSKHILSRELRSGLLRHALAQLGVHGRRMRAASDSSQLGARSTLLAISEAGGVAAGLLRYRIARLQARALYPDVP